MGGVISYVRNYLAPSGSSSYSVSGATYRRREEDRPFLGGGGASSRAGDTGPTATTPAPRGGEGRDTYNSQDTSASGRDGEESCADLVQECMEELKRKNKEDDRASEDKPKDEEEEHRENVTMRVSDGRRFSELVPRSNEILDNAAAHHKAVLAKQGPARRRPETTYRII